MAKYAVFLWTVDSWASGISDFYPKVLDHQMYMIRFTNDLEFFCRENHLHSSNEEKSQKKRADPEGNFLGHSAVP